MRDAHQQRADQKPGRHRRPVRHRRPWTLPPDTRSDTRKLGHPGARAPRSSGTQRLTPPGTRDPTTRAPVAPPPPQPPHPAHTFAPSPAPSEPPAHVQTCAGGPDRVRGVDQQRAGQKPGRQRTGATPTHTGPPSKDPGQSQTPHGPGRRGQRLDTTVRHPRLGHPATNPPDHHLPQLTRTFAATRAPSEPPTHVQTCAGGPDPVRDAHQQRADQKPGRHRRPVRHRRPRRLRPRTPGSADTRERRHPGAQTPGSSDTRELGHPEARAPNGSRHPGLETPRLEHPSPLPHPNHRTPRTPSRPPPHPANPPPTSRPAREHQTKCATHTSSAPTRSRAQIDASAAPAA